MTASERTPAHYIRPSAKHALSLCHGRAQMEALVWNRYTRHLMKDDQEEESSDVASMGTTCHAIIGHCVEQWILWGIHPQECVAEAATQFPTLSSWDVGCIRSCIRYLMLLVERVGATRDQVLVEQHLSGEPVGNARGGTADIVIVIPFELVVVVDWKFGFLEQDEAPENDQLGDYAVMAADTFTAETVEVHIYQPRLEADLRASAARFQGADLREYAKWSKQVALAALSPTAELKPGLSQCLYCSATHCPARREWIVNIMEAAEQLPEQATPEFVGQLFAAAKTAGNWFDDKAKGVKAWAKIYRQKNGPGSIAGFKLKASGDQRFIRDADMPKLWAIAEEHGLTSQVLELASVPLGKLEAVAGEHFSAFDPIIDKKPKAPALVAGKEE